MNRLTRFAIPWTLWSRLDGSKATMPEDNGSVNAEVSLTVVNTSGFNLPQTGDYGTWMFTVGGVLRL